MSGVSLLTIKIFLLLFSIILMIKKEIYVGFAKLLVTRKKMKKNMGEFSTKTCTFSPNAQKCVDCWDKVTYVADSKPEINPFIRRK